VFGAELHVEFNRGGSLPTGWFKNECLRCAAH